MATVNLTERTIKTTKRPTEGYSIIWDEQVKGFGVRFTPGSTAFIYNYRTRGGRQRRYKIGYAPDFSVDAARDEARDLAVQVSKGHDPLAHNQAERGAPTFKDLADYYIEKHLPKKRSAKTDEFAIEALLDKHKLGMRKVAEITFNDIDALHHKITKEGYPYRANRVVALLSKMFTLAIKKGWRTDNPAKGVERNEEIPRERYLSGDELARLTKILDAWPDQRTANAIRLLLYTGARRGEVLGATWDQFDLSNTTWTKPSSHTKTKKVHTVPLSDAAFAVLSKMQDERVKSDRMSPYLFPGRSADHRVDLKKPWPAICKQAGITGLRIHDLRHSFASVLVAGGASLPMIGKLLGHTQVSTTQRYAHLDVGFPAGSRQQGRRGRRRRAEGSHQGCKAQRTVDMPARPFDINEVMRPEFQAELEEAADALVVALEELLDDPTIH